MLGKVRDWLAFGLGALVLQAFCIAAAQTTQTAAEPNQTASQAEPQSAPIEPTIDAPVTQIQSNQVQAQPCKKNRRCVVVADAFLEMHSGPGRGYPIFHVAGRDEQIEVLKRRTDWFYVRTDREIEGWVSREQILATLETTGTPLDIHEPTRADYTTRRWEVGMFAGRMETASLLALFGGYGLSDHLTAELTLAGAVGPVAANYLATIGLNHTFAPEWWASPYAGIGTGVIIISPRATLVQSTDRTDQIGYVTLGVRAYLARRFVARFEYRGNVVFTSRNENEAIHEWKLGFGIFF